MHALLWREALVGEARAPAWRVVEAQSFDARAFRLELTWSAGLGASRPLTVALSRGGRICVFARTVRVRLANLCDAQHRVEVRVATSDNPVQTSNVDVVEASIDPQLNELVIPLSEMARRVRFQVDPTVFASGTGRPSMRLFDGAGLQIVELPIADQPAQGFDLAGAQELHVVGVPAAAVAPRRAGYLRTIYELAV